MKDQVSLRDYTSLGILSCALATSACTASLDAKVSVGDGRDGSANTESDAGGTGGSASGGSASGGSASGGSASGGSASGGSASGGSASGGSSSTTGSATGASTGATAGTGSAGGASASAASGGAAGHPEGGAPPPDPCKGDAGCPVGQWSSVTPAGVSLDPNAGTCGNYGTKTVQVDSNRPQDIYTLFFCQGVWKSTDYGQTWNGPVNTGSNGSTFADCAGGITIPPHNTQEPPVVYASCIRGAGLGFWRSMNGGVDWTRYAGPGDSQQFYPPTVDPYDQNHLLMTGHAVDQLVESFDGGQTWITLTTDLAMAMGGGTGEIAFIDNGNAASTRITWLWLAAASGGAVGTWRTPNGGKTWKQVDTNEHVNGSTQVYQPDLGGVIYMAGVYSNLGWGVLRSTDYGMTWQHVGGMDQETIVFGTSKSLYALYGWGQVDPVNLEVAPPLGTGTWTTQATPPSMNLGPAQAGATSDGKHNIILLANFNGGVWRYIEP